MRKTATGGGRERSFVQGDRLAVFARYPVPWGALTIVWLALSCGPLARPAVAQQACLEPLPAEGSRFGTQVSIDGDTLLVDSSQGAAYVFERVGGVWRRQARISQQRVFRGSAALSGDRLLLGGRGVPPMVMRRDGNGWAREAVLNPPGGITASYGQFYALSGDLAVVSAHEAGRVHFFRRDADRWTQEGHVQRANLFGWTLALDGDVAVVGDFGADLGTAVVLRRSVSPQGASWEIETELRPSDSSDRCRWFGADVAISGDVILVGTAPDFAQVPCGRVHVFRYASEQGGWNEEQILAPAVALSDRVGVSVSVSGDVAVIGAMGDSRFEGGSGFGRIFAYVYDGSVWQPAAKLAAPDQRANDWFARQVAVSGRTLVTGAENANSRAGAAYTFTLEERSAFSVRPEQPTVGEEVRFEPSPANGGGSAYVWDLGGEVTAEGPLVTRSYTDPGRFLVSLRLGGENDACGEALKTITVTGPAGDVAPWTSGSVGRPPFPGTADFEGEGDSRELVLWVGGRGVAARGRTDEFHFVYQQVSGDAVLTSHVREADLRAGARIGVTLRESLEPGARHATIVVELPPIPLANGRFQFIHREEPGDVAQVRDGRSARTPATWVQIRRERNEFVGLSSADGESWEEVHRVTLNLPPTVLAGVVADGRDSHLGEPYSPLVARVSELALTSTAPAFRRGDANSDGVVNIADGVALLDFLFGGTRTPPCAASGDADDSGRLEISDAIHLFNFLFAGGPNPPAPGTACGGDPTPDELSCDLYAPCL